MLAGGVVDVEHVGSTSVSGLLAKPILDMVTGVTDEPALDQVAEPLGSAGWIYRGDGGDQDGLLFVLEAWAGIASPISMSFDMTGPNGATTSRSATAC